MGAVLVAVGGLLLIYFRNPAHGGIFPPCPFLWLTGLYCPGCGSLRALHELLHLHPAKAFALNPLLVIGLPFVLSLALWRRPRGPKVYYGVMAVILIYWVARNIPFHPFSLLAPH